MASKSMKFGAHYLPTYVADLDGSVTEFYQKMFGQMEEMDRLGYDHVWVTEHHFAHYGGDLPHPPTFMSATWVAGMWISIVWCPFVLCHVELTPAMASASGVSSSRSPSPASPPGPTVLLSRPILILIRLPLMATNP